MESMTMEQTINALLEADSDARQLLRENQQRRQQMADQMAIIKENMQKEGYDRAQAEIESFRQQQSQSYKQESNQLQASYQAALDELKTVFESRRDEWVKSMIARCLR